MDNSFWKLTSLFVATQSVKSLIVGMGLTNGDNLIPTAKTAIDISYLEEHHQMSFWGEDPSWIEKQKSMTMWLDACQKFSKCMP